MHTTPHTLEGWLRHCEQIHPVGIDMGLERVREVAHRMALKFNCPVITVAGTNGKGSTCAMLEAVALQAGYRTGVYTSPHLVHFQERCRVHGEIVSPADLLPHFEAVEKARTQGGDEVSLTYFEFTTLAILRLMSHSLLDVAILEVGLGGGWTPPMSSMRIAPSSPASTLTMWSFLGRTVSLLAVRRPASCARGVPRS